MPKPFVHHDQLDIKNCVAILVSADFLRIEPLIEEACAFISQNLNDLLRMPIDFSCINDKLMSKISSMLKIEELDSLNDGKDRLKSRLFMNKTE